MKKLWKYLTITLLLLVGLCCVGLLYIFFVPGTSLFSICYISYNDNFTSAPIDCSSITQISLNSNRYNIKLLSSEDSSSYVKLYVNSFGFTTTKYKQAGISHSTANSILTINVSEPVGAVISTNSYIELYIPIDKPVDLKINNKRAIASVDSNNLIINNLYYSTSNGELLINSAEILGDINLSLGNSYFTIDEDTILHNNDVYLDITTGKFDSSAAALGNIKVNNNKRGVIVVGSCNTLTEEVKSAGGRIEVDTVYATLSITTSDTNIYAKNVMSAVITLTKSGNVTIDNIVSYSTIDTHTGNITLDLCASNVLATSDYGNITIKNAVKMVIAKSLKSGNISIKYHEQSEQYSASNNYRCIDVEINKGQLFTTDIENATIKITGNASVVLNMRNVLGISNINVGKGSARVIVDADAQYNLTSVADTGSTRVNLLQIADFGGYTNNITSSSPLSVNGNTDLSRCLNLQASSGNITVLDTKLA